MTNARPGWYPDGESGDRLRWWDGQSWTEHVAVSPTIRRPDAPAVPTPAARSRTWIWAPIGLAVAALSLVLAPVMTVVATVTLITGIVALAKRRPTWLRLRTRQTAMTLTAVSAAVLLVAGGVSAATLPDPALQHSPQAAPFVVGTPRRTDPTSPTSSPTPVRTTTTLTTTQPIPFVSRTVGDSRLAKGTSEVKTAGVNGLRVLTFTVTLVDGKEVSRQLISNVIRRQPVAQVTVVGTYVAPPKPAPQKAAPRCDPNYAGACVPIASDVDCAGGSGNGPAYFTGTARVVGSDIYDLDRDNDGIACDR